MRPEEQLFIRVYGECSEAVVAPYFFQHSGWIGVLGLGGFELVKKIRCFVSA